MANKYENAENIGKLVSGGTLSELGKKVNASEKRVSEILKKLSDMESAIQAAKKQEEERIASEQAERERAERAAAEAAKQPAAEEASAVKQERPAPEPEKQPEQSAPSPAEDIAEPAPKAESSAGAAEAASGREQSATSPAAAKPQPRPAAAAQQPVRRQENAVTAEGERLIADLPEDVEISVLYIDAEKKEKYARLAQRAKQVIYCTSNVMRALSDTATPCGVLAVTEMPHKKFKEGALVIADGGSDPGNLGAVIRTAAACGAGSCISNLRCWQTSTLRRRSCRRRSSGPCCR